MLPITGLTGTDTFETWFGKTNEIISSLNSSTILSVKDAGAVGDGVTDDTASIKTALSSGKKVIYFPSGTYKVTQGLTLPAFVSIFGDGPDATIIDGSSCTANGLGSYETHIRTAEGTWSSLPALASPGITKGDQNITFVSAHGLTFNDEICVYNPTDYSWSKFTSYHRAGEVQFIAWTPSTTIVRLQGSAYANYKSTDVSLYKLSAYTSCFIKNFTLKCAKLGPVTSGRGVRVNQGLNCILENVKVVNVPYAGIEINQSHNVLVNNCTVQEDASDDFGGDYGLAIMNSSSVLVNGGYYSASRHAVTIGGGSGVGAVPNRNVKIIGTSCHTSGVTLDAASAGALDVHSNAEHILFRNCTINGGIAGLGGDNITVEGCHIVGRGAGDSLIYGAGCKGTNFAIHNNHLISTRKGRLNRGAFIDIGAQNDAISDKTSEGGIISIKNNTLDWQYSPTSSGRREAGETASDGYSSYGNWLSIVNTGTTGYTGGDIIIDIQGNTVKAPNNYHQGGAYIQVTGNTLDAQFNVVNFSNNTCVNVGGAELDSSWVSANHVIFQGNNIINSGNVGLKASGVKKSIVCKDNSINGTRNSPAIYLRGRSSSWLGWNGFCEFIEVSENTVNNGVLTKDYTFNTAILTDYSVFYFYNGIFRDNIMGSDNRAFILDTNRGFVLNETVTGNSSNAVATIKAFQGITQFGIGVTNNSGSFTLNEIITGNISGKTASLTGIASTHSFGSYLFTGNNLWSGKNAWWSGFTLTLSGITTNNIL
jgi:hypothetical protein